MYRSTTHSMNALLQELLRFTHTCTEPSFLPAGGESSCSCSFCSFWYCAPPGNKGCCRKSKVLLHYVMLHKPVILQSHLLRLGGDSTAIAASRRAPRRLLMTIAVLTRKCTCMRFERHGHDRHRHTRAHTHTKTQGQTMPPHSCCARMANDVRKSHCASHQRCMRSP